MTTMGLNEEMLKAYARNQINKMPITITSSQGPKPAPLKHFMLFAPLRG